MTWLSHPVLDLRPHYDDPALITGRDLTFARRGFGQVTPWANQPNAQRTLSLPFVLIGKAQIAAFRRFFETLAGRAGLFWVPAYQNAMALQSDVSAEAGSLTCGDTGLADRLFQHPGYIHAALVSATALQPFQIESVTVSDGAMIVSSTEIIGQEFAAASTMVSWLMLVRLQADELAFTYLTDALALVTLNGIEVPREYPPYIPPLPVVTSESLAEWAAESFSYPVLASSSPTSYTADDLPEGLSLDTSTGLITGAVATAGTYIITLHASNARGTGSGTLTLEIRAYMGIVFSLVDHSSYGDDGHPPDPLLSIALDGGSYETVVPGQTYRATSAIDLKQTVGAFSPPVGGSYKQSYNEGTIGAVGATATILSTSTSKAKYIYANVGGVGGSTTISGVRAELGQSIVPSANTLRSYDTLQSATGTTLDITTVVLSVVAGATSGNFTTFTDIEQDLNLRFTL